MRMDARLAFDPAPRPPSACFVHGLASSGAIFAPACRRLRTPLAMRLPDLPWATPGQGRLMHERWPLETDDAALVADAVASGGAAPDVVVAHSFGALATMEALCRGLMPMPRALVLVSPFYRARVEDFAWETLAYYVEDFHLVLAEGLAAAATRRAPPADHLAGMASKVRERVGPVGWLHFFRAYCASPALALARIDCPVLVVGGEEDISAFPRDAHALCAALPHARCAIFAGGRHFVFLEDPDRFAALVDGFLDDALTPSRDERTTR